MRWMQADMLSIMSTNSTQECSTEMYGGCVLMLHGNFFNVKSQINLLNSDDVDVCFVNYGPASWLQAVIAYNNCNSSQTYELTANLAIGG